MWSRGFGSSDRNGESDAVVLEMTVGQRSSRTAGNRGGKSAGQGFHDVAAAGADKPTDVKDRRLRPTLTVYADTSADTPLEPRSPQHPPQWLSTFKRVSSFEIVKVLSGAVSERRKVATSSHLTC